MGHAIALASMADAIGPRGIGALTYWVRADLGITKAGSNVTAWADHSGTGDSNKNATPPGTSPTFNASDAAFNNLPTLSFASASTEYLHTGVWTTALTQPYTIFWVGLTDQLATECFWDDRSTVENAAGFCTTSGIIIGTNAGGATLGFNTTAIKSACCLVCVYSSASSVIYLNGGAAQATGAMASTSNLTGVTIGAFQGGTSPLNGKVAEMAVFKGALTAGQAESLAQYSKRYGITVS